MALLRKKLSDSLTKVTELVEVNLPKHKVQFYLSSWNLRIGWRAAVVSSGRVIGAL